MRIRKISVMTTAVVALGLALTACNDGADNASSVTSSASAEAASTPQSDPARSTTSETPAQSDEKCTDQVDYAGDPRPNAEINSIGENTGTCPPVQKSPSDEKCTDQLDYAGDPRPNAEINSIGENTGTCPPVEPK
ncbi:hypothetical protein ADK82_21180 [Streptomyces sp. NRRL S-4]|nr:hypothetical protein ADK82_21180 [Streptomyces sp. NRRL S-4]